MQDFRHNRQNPIQQDYDTKNMQILYYKNMEFFKNINPKLFHALTKNPQEYNVQVDEYGLNIIHLPSNTLHYPFILRNSESTDSHTITAYTHKSSMIEAHKDLAQNPIKNLKWKLFANFHTNIESHFINEETLPITGKYCNAMLRKSIDIALQVNNSNHDVANQNKEVHDSSHINTDSLYADKKDMTQEQLSQHINDIVWNHFCATFTESKFLPQTSIYGLMGGLFLQDLLMQGYTFHSLLIYEEHIDLFRISLYFLDYQKLFANVAEQSCFIIIKDISIPLVRAFLYAKKLTNNFLSLELQHYTTQNTQNLRDLIAKEKKAAMRGWGSFEDEKIGFMNAITNLQSCYMLQPNIKRVNAPICVVGNGASLDLCLDFIKAYQDNMIIVSCGTALKVLRHHNIRPDFQVEIERVKYLADVLKEADLGDVPLLFAQTTDTKAVQLGIESFAFMRGGSSSAYIDSAIPALEFSAPFVGNAGVVLGTLLGSDCILCGIDCGYIEGYSKHAKNSFYGKEKVEIPKDCFAAVGNKSLRVYSNDLFYLSAKNIEEAIKIYAKNHVINLGYGMKFDGALSLYEDDFIVQSIDKQQAVQNLKNNFMPYNLTIDSTTMLQDLEDCYMRIESILDAKVEQLSDMFAQVDSILAVLQHLIMQQEKRKSIILLEGSSLHLSLSLLLSCIFAGVFLPTYLGNLQSYDIIKQDFKQALQAIIAQCADMLP